MERQYGRLKQPLLLRQVFKAQSLEVRVHRRRQDILEEQALQQQAVAGTIINRSLVSFVCILLSTHSVLSQTGVEPLNKGDHHLLVQYCNGNYRQKKSIAEEICTHSN